MGRTQISINDMLTIPQHKPDIQSIHHIYTTAIIDKTITIKKKIYFSGHVDICIEYVACSSDCTQHIHFLRTEIPFNSLLLHPFARERFNAILKTKIKFCQTDITSSRTINTIILLKLCKVKFSRIPHAQKYCYNSKQYPSSKYSECHYANNSIPCCPTYNDYACKPPSQQDCTPYNVYDHQPHHSQECKQLDSCDDAKLASHKQECMPDNNCHCKSPVSDQEYQPYSSEDNVCENQPHHNQECKQLDSCDDAKPASHKQECMPDNNYHCKYPVSYQEYQPHPNKDCKLPSKHDNSETEYGDGCNQSSYKYGYKSYYSGYCKPWSKEPVLPDGYHVPTCIEPYTRMGNSHGVAFCHSYEE
jgi:hypothetical protein